MVLQRPASARVPAPVDGTVLVDRTPDLSPEAAAGPAGDALAVLFDTQYARMLRLATGLLGDVASAEDAVQDALTSMHTSWARVRDKEHATGYLHRCVVNAARSRLRRVAVTQRSRYRRSLEVPSAEDEVLSGWLSGPVVAAVRALPRREREAVLLRYYLDVSEKDAAQLLGVSCGAVKAYASRGLARLRAELVPATGRVAV